MRGVDQSTAHGTQNDSGDHGVSQWRHSVWRRRISCVGIRSQAVVANDRDFAPERREQSDAHGKLSRARLEKGFDIGDGGGDAIRGKALQKSLPIALLCDAGIEEDKDSTV